MALKLGENFICTVYNFVGESREFCNLHTVAVVSSTPFYFSQENYVVTYFAHCYEVVFDAFQFAFKFCQFMIMGGEKAFCAYMLMAVYIFDYRPCYAQSVICAGSSSYFVKDYQAIPGCVCQNIG